jgi:hypothetical protein
MNQNATDDMLLELAKKVEEVMEVAIKYNLMPVLFLVLRFQLARRGIKS